MDANVYERLKEKKQRMLDAIDSHVLEAMPTSDEELEAIFAQLRLEKNRYFTNTSPTCGTRKESAEGGIFDKEGHESLVTFVELCLKK